jgi:hypothetical protein
MNAAGSSFRMSPLGRAETVAEIFRSISSELRRLYVLYKLARSRRLDFSRLDILANSQMPAIRYIFTI